MIKAQDIDLDLFIPLLEETIKKIKIEGAYKSQTGPARRNDTRVIEHHIKLLKDHPDLLEIYNLFTESIKKTYYENPG